MHCIQAVLKLVFKVCPISDWIDISRHVPGSQGKYPELSAKWLEWYKSFKTKAILFRDRPLYTLPLERPKKFSKGAISIVSRAMIISSVKGEQKLSARLYMI
jgi:hypothetical protein